MFIELQKSYKEVLYILHQDSPTACSLSFPHTPFWCVFPINKDILLWCNYQNKQINIDTVLVIQILFMFHQLSQLCPVSAKESPASCVSVSSHTSLDSFNLEQLLRPCLCFMILLLKKSGQLYSSVP